MRLILPQVLAGALLLDMTVAAAPGARSWWEVTDYRTHRTLPSHTNRRALSNSKQSLKPTPGEIKGLGSRFPDIGVAPGTAGGPKYYPNVMQPIEPE